MFEREIAFASKYSVTDYIAKLLIAFLQSATETNVVNDFVYLIAFGKLKHPMFTAQFGKFEMRLTGQKESKREREGESKTIKLRSSFYDKSLSPRVVNQVTSVIC